MRHTKLLHSCLCWCVLLKSSSFVLSIQKNILWKICSLPVFFRIYNGILVIFKVLFCSNRRLASALWTWKLWTTHAAVVRRHIKLLGILKLLLWTWLCFNLPPSPQSIKINCSGTFHPTSTLPGYRFKDTCDANQKNTQKALTIVFDCTLIILCTDGLVHVCLQI